MPHTTYIPFAEPWARNRRLPSLHRRRRRPLSQGAMDAEAFLAAQLWLRRLPNETWPLADGDSEDGDRTVILAQARCCFLLEDRPSAALPPPRVTRACSGGSNSSCDSDNSRTSGARSDSPRSRQRRPRPLWLSAGGATASSAAEPNAFGSAKGNNPGPSPALPSEASNNRTDGPVGRRSSSSPAVTMAVAEGIDPGPLRREFDFGLAISRPREEGRNGDGDHAPPPAEGSGSGGGALLLGIEGKVFRAEHTLIRSIAYPRGGGGGGRGAGSEPGGNRNAPQGRDAEKSDSHRSCGSGANGRERPAAPARGIGLPPRRPPPAALAAPAAEAAAAAAGAKRRLGASAANGAGDVAGVGREGAGCCGHGRRPEGIGKRGRSEAGRGGVAGAVGRGDGNAADAAARRARRSEDGEDGVEEGMPFCGLFFPGVLLKFWLPQRGKNPAGTRAEAVKRMQGVVSNMLAGLSPSLRYDCPRGGGGGGDGGGIAGPGLDGEIRSVVAEAKEDGFRLRCRAWDEFVYGSHVLLGQERAASDQDPQQSGGGGAGHPLRSRTCARCLDLVEVDAPVLSGLSSSRGREDRRVGGTVGGGEPPFSDVGRARALTCLAECFSKASLPSSVKLCAQRQLQEAAVSAGRELEDALERAFPLDLSQGTDTNNRASVVSELEESLHRVQAARKAALTLALLPASEMLDESGDNA